MRHVRQMGLIGFALLLAVSTTASAQRTTRQSSRSSGYPWEFGLDARLSFGLDDPRVTTLNIPVGNLRAGFFTNDQWEIEPFFSLDYTNIENGGSLTTYSLGSGVLYHFSPSRTRSQLYVRPFVGLFGASVNPAGAGASTSTSDVGLGVGVGMKWPKLGGRIAWRGEANFATTGDATSLNLLWGISLFTR